MMAHLVQLAIWTAVLMAWADERDRTRFARIMARWRRANGLPTDGGAL